MITVVIVVMSTLSIIIIKGKNTNAGLPRAALQALRRADEVLRGRVLQVLFTFFTSLSNKHDAAAMKVLVEGGVVELMANYMADASVSMLSNGLGMLLVLSEDKEGRKRMGSPKLVEPFTKGVSKWLREVRRGGRRLGWCEGMISKV